MKRLITYFIGVIALLAILTGCQDKEFYTSKDRVKEGLPVQVSLKFQVDMSKSLTRAAQEEKYEYWLDNLYILMFDETGNRIEITDDNGTPHSFFQAGEEGGAFNPSNGGTEVQGQLSFKAVTANDARIVGIANLETTSSSTAYSITKEDLDGIDSFSQLQEMVMSIQDAEPIERGGLFMMTGYVEDESGGNKITIAGEEGGVTTLEDYSLKLRRVDAKVEVNMSAEAGNSSWQHFSFRPSQWRVMRVPKQSLVIPAMEANEQGNWDADGDYVDTQFREFEKLVEVDEENEHLYRGGSFVFYMPENRKAPKEEILSDNYALRDEMNSEPTDGAANGKPGQTHENTDFKYANDNATYLILTGHLSYTNENGEEINADTRYIIHLGYADEPKDVNDYNTRRNGCYTYNIKVKGVNDIEVEVNNQNETRPGYEGDIVYSSNQIFQLDSHYDRELLKIKKTDITEGMTWSVKTPFSSGIYTPGTEIAQELKDYKWIKFAINKLYGVEGEDVFVKYPGDLNYDDPDVSDGPADNASSPSFPGYPGARLMDIHQLINYLKSHKDDTSLYNGDHICITAFVDENLYFVNPVTGETTGRSLWKSSVEKEDRQLHIITEDAKYSPDGNSSIVHSLYTFTQKAIRTVFNVDKESLTTAWGLESVMETERLVPGDVSQGTSTRNGRENTLKWLEGKKWTEVMNTSVQYGLNTGYESAAYACLLRNRDLNGDNIVDGREVRWYLAAIDQLTDIYLGEYALDESSRLYPTNSINRPGGTSVYWHYTSSSANENDGNNPWVLWAEEGASRGSYGGDYGSKAVNGPNYSYRCVRNLGLALDSPEEEPADLVAIQGNIIDLSNMNPKSLRSNFETTTLPPHNEQSANNRPYTRFEVYDDISPSPIVEGKNGDSGYWGWLGYSHDEIDLIWKNLYQWNYFQNSNPCPAGYRVPNQRELLIMTSRMTESGQWPTRSVTVKWYEGRPAQFPKEHTETLTEEPPFYMCQTSFSMDGKAPYTSERDGFMWSTASKVFMLRNNNSETGYVRCVRDVRE